LMQPLDYVAFFLLGWSGVCLLMKVDLDSSKAVEIIIV
jgi:hypothetical protein